MARTPSTMLPLGTAAPDFTLPDPRTGKTVSLHDFDDAPALLVMFICNHCPYVILLKEALSRMAKDYADKGLAVVAISSNSVETHPADSPDKMAEDAKQFDYIFPYLYDESQDVAKAYQAACTPDFFLFDGDRALVYRGQFDDARPGSDTPVTGADLRAAIDAVLNGQPVPTQQKPSLGCNIKWTPGAEPPYHGAV